MLSALNAKLLFCSVVPEVNKSNTANFRAKVLQGLKDLCHTAYLTRDIKECLTLILSVAINSLNADSGSIMLTDPKKKPLSVTPNRKLGKELPVKLPAPVNHFFLMANRRKTLQL